MIIHLIFDKVVYIKDMPEINKSITFIDFLFLQCLLLVDWQSQFIKSVFVILLKVFFDLRMCIFQWDVADHEVGPLLFAFEDLFHVNRTSIVFAHV